MVVLGFFFFACKEMLDPAVVGVEGILSQGLSRLLFLSLRVEKCVHRMSRFNAFVKSCILLSQIFENTIITHRHIRAYGVGVLLSSHDDDLPYL